VLFGSWNRAVPSGVHSTATSVTQVQDAIVRIPTLPNASVPQLTALSPWCGWCSRCLPRATPSESRSVAFDGFHCCRGRSTHRVLMGNRPSLPHTVETPMCQYKRESHAIWPARAKLCACTNLMPAMDVTAASSLTSKWQCQCK